MMYSMLYNAGIISNKSSELNNKKKNEQSIILTMHGIFF